MTWLATKLFFKKTWIFLKENWQIPFLVVWTLPQDLEYAANELGFPHWKFLDGICAWCPADRMGGGCDYRNVSDAANLGVAW